MFVKSIVGVGKLGPDLVLSDDCQTPRWATKILTSVMALPSSREKAQYLCYSCMQAVGLVVRISKVRPRNSIKPASTHSLS